jgi:hypothetical protein
MDAGLHQLQGKATGVKPSELIGLLQECYRDRLAQLERHEAVATHVSNYDVNNTYQYVINREETHLAWLRDAIADLGGALPDPPPGPSITVDRSRDGWRLLAGEDAQTGQRFFEKWRPRVEALTHARHQTMLRLMLGEIQEQVRFFEQAAAGQDDLLGRKAEGASKRGLVAATRWIGN